MEDLKRVWKDPVWSKVIASAIIGLFTFIYLYIKAKLNEITLVQSTSNFFEYPIKVKFLIITLLFLGLLNLIYKKLKPKKINAFLYLDEHKQLDKLLFIKIKEQVLPVNGSIQFIRSYNFGNSFIWEPLNDLQKFGSFEDDPTFEFIDPEMNSVLFKLKQDVSDFLHYLALNTWQIKQSKYNRSSIPEEWKTGQPERYDQTLNKINELTLNICKEYDKLIKLGRIKFGV